MNYSDIFARIKNRRIVPYLMILKEAQYLIVRDENKNMIFRFFKKDGIIYEIYDIFSTHDISEYYVSDDAMTHSFSILSYDEEGSRRCSYTIYDRQGYVDAMKEQLKNDVDKTVSERNGHDTYSIIRQSLSNDIGKFVTFSNDGDISDSDQCGLLVAASTTDEDCYYIYVDKDLNVCFMTAVGGYTVIRDDDIIEHRFDRLKKIIDSSPERIIEMVNEKTADSIDYIFTPLGYFTENKVLNEEKIKKDYGK